MVGILANNPMVRAGAIDHMAADKQVRFMELADQFGIPLIYFVDVPGLMVGPAAELNGVIKKGMRALWMTHSIWCLCSMSTCGALMASAVRSPATAAG